MLALALGVVAIMLEAFRNSEGLGGDDAADALRYLIATKILTIYRRKLIGF
jgi:hypothetical protein